MNNKEKQIKVYVILGTLIMLLAIFSGITYAFFSASNNKGSTSIISATSGKMLISYADGTSDLLVSKDIQPSNAILVNKTFTLTGTNTTSGLSMPYKVGLKYTSTFSDGQIHYYIKEINRPSNSEVTAEYTGETNQTVQGNSSYTGYFHGTLKNENKYTEMVTGEFKANTSNQTITFNLILQFPDTGEKQDSEKGKEINGKVVVNYEPPKVPSFAKDSWETIASYVYNRQFDVYPVGSEKEVVLRDGNSYTVRVANNTHPSECNDSNFSQTACGFVIEFVDIVENRVMNPSGEHNGTNYQYGWNVEGWPGSEMRTYANGEFFNKIPSDLQKIIRPTKVVSGHGNSDRNAKSVYGNWESEDKIYLLSAHEVWEEDKNGWLLGSDTAYNSTRQLDYYAEKGVTTSSFSGTNITNIKKNINGEASYWWLRSANYNDDLSFISVTPYDGSSAPPYANNTFGFAPAFRIGS